MIFIAHLLVVVALAGYLVGAGAGAIGLIRGQSRWGVALVRGVALLSVSALVGVCLLVILGEGTGIQSTPLYYITCLLLVEGGSWVAGLRSVRDRVWLSTGAIAILVTMSVLAHFSPEPLTAAPGGTPGVLLGFHLVSALVAEGCLALVAIVAGAAVAADRRLRRMQLPLPGDEEPSLVRLDALYRWLVIGGFCAMTVSAVTGGVWSLMSHAPVRVDVTLFFALVSWGVLLVLMHLRCIVGWPVTRVAPVVASGVVLLFVCYLLGAMMRGDILHRRFVAAVSEGEGAE